MSGYRVICIFGLVFSIISAAVLVLSTLFRDNHRYNRERDVIIVGSRYAYELSPIEALFDGMISLAVEIYIFICINSLYLEIKERSRRVETQIPAHNVFISQQQPQPVISGNVCTQSPPSYNAAMQQVQPGYSTQVVIPMQPLYPDVSNFKPQAV